MSRALLARGEMREQWQIGIGVELCVMADGEEPPRGAESVSPEQATAWMRWSRDGSARSQRMLLEMAEAITGVGSTPRTSVDWALRVVERAVADGHLRAILVRNTEGGGKGPEVVERRREAPPQETKTFVAIQLLTDEPEPKPVSFKRYRIELPDCSVREGQLDAFGKAQVVGIDPGMCKVSFPDFDAADWKAA